MSVPLLGPQAASDPSVCLCFKSNADVLSTWRVVICFFHPSHIIVKISGRHNSLALSFSALALVWSVTSRGVGAGRAQMPSDWRCLSEMHTGSCVRIPAAWH